MKIKKPKVLVVLETQRNENVGLSLLFQVYIAGHLVFNFTTYLFKAVDAVTDLIPGKLDDTLVDAPASSVLNRIGNHRWILVGKDEDDDGDEGKKKIEAIVEDHKKAA